MAFARSWCYEHKLLIPGDRVLTNLVRRAIPQAEQELLGAVENAVPEPVWCKYSNAPYDIVINQYYG